MEKWRVKSIVTTLNILIFLQSSFAFGKTHFILQPNEKREPIEIEESCLVMLRDYQTTLFLPFGKTFDWTFPKGTKLKIPKGKYELENKSASVLEFNLLPIQKCSE